MRLAQLYENVEFIFASKSVTHLSNQWRS